MATGGFTRLLARWGWVLGLLAGLGLWVVAAQGDPQQQTCSSVTKDLCHSGRSDRDRF